MKVPDFGNVMGQFAPRLQELDHQINVLGTQRGEVAQRRFNTVLEEFHALVPEVEFGKTVVSHLQDRGGYRGQIITRIGIACELQLSMGWGNELNWSLPVVHLTRLTAWDRKNWDSHGYEGDSSKFNRRTTHQDPSSHIKVGDEFEIVGEVVSSGKYGVYEVKFL